MNKINSIRKDWSLIETLITQDRKILDIGCGDGGLMEQLEKNRNAITHGIELNRELAANAISRGFNVVHGNAELDLSQYSNNSCLLYTSPSPRDKRQSRMPSSA